MMLVFFFLIFEKYFTNITYAAIKFLKYIKISCQIYISLVKKKPYAVCEVWRLFLVEKVFSYNKIKKKDTFL